MADESRFYSDGVMGLSTASKTRTRIHAKGSPDLRGHIAHVAGKKDGRLLHAGTPHVIDAVTVGHKHERRGEKEHGGSKRADRRHAPDTSVASPEGE